MANRQIWDRDERVFAFISDRRARYPSITKTANDRQLLLLAHQSEEQERAGGGDLVLMKCSADGKWWLDKQVIYESANSQPRAYGTMTTLGSGTIMAPFTEMNDQSATCDVRIATSHDHGDNIHISDPIDTNPLCWAAPCGRPLEFDGTLIMPVFGALSSEELAQTRHTCGLLRSTDGGKSWGDWSVIASGTQGEMSYEHFNVVRLADGKLLAVLTGRRFDRSIDAVQVLLRCYSNDGGRSWSEPDQLCVGSWPGLAVLTDGTVVCAYTIWCGWGQMRLLVSDDGMRTFYLDQVFLELGWLPVPDHYPKVPLYPDKELELEETGRGRRRPFWAYNPLPLPPVVPFMNGDWEAGHFGFPAVMGLSDDKLVVTLGRRQQGSGYSNPPQECDLPIELERIETITFDRLPPPETSAPICPRKQTTDRWKIAESWTPQRWQEVLKRPTSMIEGGESDMDFAGGYELRSGRVVNWVSHEPTDHFDSPITGRSKGYWVYSDHRVHKRKPGYFVYSNDNGKTWTEAQMVEPTPLTAYSGQSGQIFEDSDGAIVAPFYGYMNERDMNNHHYGCCLCRSRDEGLTWGDWSTFAYDAEDKRSSLCEATLLPIEDDFWIAFMRTEMSGDVPWMGAMMTRTVSTDRGYTWSKPQLCMDGSQPALVTLPDGGLVLVVRTHGRQGPGIYFSYDRGETWDYALAGPYNTSDAGMLDDESFWVFSGNEVVIYRKK